MTLFLYNNINNLQNHTFVKCPINDAEVVDNGVGTPANLRCL